MGSHRRLILLLGTGIVLIGATISVKTAKSYIERRYLDAAFRIVQAHSVNRRDVNWSALREQAAARNRHALTRADTYDTIRFVLTSLRDHHSGLVVPEVVTQLKAMTAADNPSAEGTMLSARLGYVRVPPFVSGNQEAIDQAATRLQDIVREVDGHHPCGWVVDLRNNGGGNMWPMLAGLGPLLGQGRLGSFIDPDGRQTDWSYANGAASESGQPRAQVSGAGYASQAATAPVVVLINRGTASSGEAVAIAFIGRPNTRLLGQHTRGLSSSNDQFFLSDGALINLSVSSFANRAGHRYPTGIEPDQEVAGPGERAPEAARAWLLTQPRCAAK